MSQFGPDQALVRLPPTLLPEPRPSSLARRSLGDLEDPKEADATQHRNAQGGHGTRLHQQDLQDSAAHHEAVEAVEDGHEVLAQAQPVHLHQHLDGEEGQQHAVGNVCRVGGRTSAPPLSFPAPASGTLPWPLPPPLKPSSASPFSAPQVQSHLVNVAH